MAQPKFSYNEAIKFGWVVVKNNLIFFIKLLSLIFLVNFSLGLVQNFLFKSSKFLVVIVGLISTVINIIIWINLIRIYLKFVDNEKPKLGDIFLLPSLSLFFKYLIGSIFYSLITVLPMIIFGLVGYGLMFVINNKVLPIIGIVIGFVISFVLFIRFRFFSYLIIDKEYNPVESLRKSFEITKGAVFNLIILGIIFSFINFLGALALLVGLFITIPITELGFIFVYRKLLNFSESNSTIEPTVSLQEK